MRLLLGAALLCLGLSPGHGSEEAAPDSPGHQDPQAAASYSDWGIDTIRDGFEAVNSYFDSFLELLGGKNGICQYRCRYGKAPMPRPHYKPQEPNGCSSHFLGLKLDLGIPAMTKCCNQLDVCYDTCGANKYRCDAKFRWCLHSICSDLKRSLGFVSKVQGTWKCLARWSFDVYCFTESSETQLRRAEGWALMAFPEMEKSKREDIPAYLTRESKGGIGSLRLSYHFCYFLFGHRRKVGSDGEKEQHC